MGRTEKSDGISTKSTRKAAFRTRTSRFSHSKSLGFKTRITEEKIKSDLRRHEKEN